MPIFECEAYQAYYEESGTGEPLVLIPGMSADLQVWRFMLPELSKRFHVITLDIRGAGRSSAPDSPYTIRQMANDVRLLMNHLHVSSANVLGWSMGGIIAQSLAMAHPNLVRRLVLLGSFVAPDCMLKNHIKNWVNIRLSNMTDESVVRHVARMVYSPELANNVAKYEAFIKAMVRNPYRQQIQGFVRQAEALVSYEPPDGLRDIRIPVSIFVGEHDQLAPPYLSRELASYFPHATLQVLPGAHSGFVEYPAHYAKAVIDALDA